MLVVVCVVLLAAGGVCEVLELTDSSFQSTVNEAELAAVVFHAPWSARRLHYTNATSSSILKSLLNTYKGRKPTICTEKEEPLHFTCPLKHLCRRRLGFCLIPVNAVVYFYL